MTVDQLIEELQRTRHKHGGDLRVVVFDGEESFVDAIGISIGYEGEHAIDVAVLDERTMREIEAEDACEFPS